MAENVLIDGNEAVGHGAILAGCTGFFGYPITPQNEVPEFMSRELPKIGGVFVQTESETAAVNMVFGAAATGARVMSSTSGPGFSLMQEGISTMADRRVPAVIVNVMRMGPGGGSGGQGGQSDYLQAVKSAGHGGCRNIVLAPSSVQEIIDLMQLAFYLADKYRMVVIVLSDFVLGRMAEQVRLEKIDFGPLPEKDWVLTGKGDHGGKSNKLVNTIITGGGPVIVHQQHVDRYRKIAKEETRYETFHLDDAELMIITYGSTARMCKEAVEAARAQGLKVGLIRPITVWPYPLQAVRDAAAKVKTVLVVEDSQGQMVEDADWAVQGRAPIHFLGLAGRHLPGGGGIIHPERIFEEVKKII